MSCSYVRGDMLIIGASKGVYMINSATLEVIASLATSEWSLSLCMLDDSTLVCG